MHQNTKRIVLTGSPSSGKTTLLNHIITLGYRCFEEVSREIIQHSMDEGLDVTPWQNLDAFSSLVWRKRIKQFEEASPGWNFYDRSLLDVVAYQELDMQPISADYERIMEQYRYDIVFIARPWPDIFINDEHRREDWNQALSVDDALIKAYKKRGYTPIVLPEVSVKERAEFVLNHISP
jgi:predicted ATPase